MVTTQANDVSRTRLAVLIASVIFLILSLTTASRVQAATDYWSILPGINSTGIYEYGWHFDESGSFGARDFNKTNDAGLTVYLRATVITDPGYDVRYYKAATTCRMDAQAQGLLSGQWTYLSGTTLHYLHLVTGTTGAAGSMRTAGSSISSSVGTIASSGSCVDGQPHLHQSGDLSASSFIYRQLNGTNDTCWADTTSLCSSFSWTRDWTSCTTYTSGSYTKSGSVSEYICEEWSQQSFGQNSAVFKIRW